MKYIINARLVFDSDNRTLFLQESPEQSIEIGFTSSRLLVEMLENIAGVDREYLLETVWSNHGLRPSNNNLNNQISLLRKSISSLTAYDDLIITLPKKGFMINKRYVIDVESDKPVKAPRVKWRKNGQASTFSISFWILSIMVIVLTSLLGYVVSHEHSSIFGLC
ncbi:winged helix-turn-helix domain-containing protein [Serratia aquatilis]|uniref:Transcriptional regulator n=1 Tax=Serratia aquatilis TaxID=1737515 RepID=A0ABV6EG59_9GAMM